VCAPVPAPAQALGRQLVMPKMLCLCERSEGPFALLPSCVLDGASTPVPHVCPLESVFDVARVESLWKTNYLQLRPWSFLNASIHRPANAPPGFDLNKEAVTVRWAADAAAAPHYDAGARVATVLRGGSDVELRAALEKVGVMEAKVLKFGQVGDGAFGGFESETFGKEFQRNIATHLLGGWSATWCCTSWDKPRGTIRFKHPVALPTGAAARAAAAAARPPEIPEKRACYWRDCDASGLQK